MASTDVISIGVTTRSRKRAREAALHLLPALQDPHDRKKFKAEYESPHGLSPRSPVHAVSLQTDSSINNVNVNQSKNAHGFTACQSSAPPPFPDDQQSNNISTIPLRNPTQVIDLTLDRHSSAPWRNSSRSSVVLSPNIRVTRSAARRAQLQGNLAHASTCKPDYPGNDNDVSSTVSTLEPNTFQYNPSLFSQAPSTPQPTSSSPNETRSALGGSVPPPDSNVDLQPFDIEVINVQTSADSIHGGDDTDACDTTQQGTTPPADEIVQTTSASDSVQESGTFISPQLSGREVFSPRNPSFPDAVKTPGSDDHTKKLTKSSPSSYLAPNPVRRAPRISTARRDTARYLLEATEKAALLAYRETRRQFPKWMSNPSRTFFKDSTYIPGGLPIRHMEDDGFRVQLNLKMDLGIGASESNFMMNDAFLQPSIGGLVGSFPSSHIQLDPDLDPLPLTARTSSSISLLHEPLGADTSLSPPTTYTSSMHSRVKKSLWYNYALSVQHAYQAPSTTTSCGLGQHDGAFSMSFESDFPGSQLLINESIYDVEKDCLDWTTPVPQYYPLSGGHMDSTSLPISSISSGDSSLGAINTYPEADLLPSLDQSCMTTTSLLTDWNMDYIAQPQREDGSSIQKTPVELVSP